jgi:hypothetical protein
MTKIVVFKKDCTIIKTTFIKDQIADIDEAKVGFHPSVMRNANKAEIAKFNKTHQVVSNPLPSQETGGDPANSGGSGAEQYDALSVPQLKSLLSQRNIEFEATASKEDLIKLAFENKILVV